MGFDSDPLPQLVPLPLAPNKKFKFSRGSPLIFYCQNCGRISTKKGGMVTYNCMNLQLTYVFICT